MFTVFAACPQDRVNVYLKMHLLRHSKRAKRGDGILSNIWSCYKGPVKFILPPFLGNRLNCKILILSLKTVIRTSTKICFSQGGRSFLDFSDSIFGGPYFKFWSNAELSHETERWQLFTERLTSTLHNTSQRIGFSTFQSLLPEISCLWTSSPWQDHGQVGSTARRRVGGSYSLLGPAGLGM